ncbi:MAG TPA: efflux RND transporter permease subunit, partial [Candidatus Barnesiella merdigallinarum]|nr:efflux RND transporter permease subunit [Candidatus Barnesiella merdigallinarum]
FILLFHFRRINMALLILGSLALCLLGAGVGIWVMGLDVSVTAVLGIVSLMGILVRNGIIMLDYADELRMKEGLSVREAALHSAKRRMRPIFLTSAAASMGVIPMILGGSPLWSPMGSVVFFGTIISMILTLTILPVAYWLIFSRADRKTENR